MRRTLLSAFAVASLLASSGVAHATHSWGSFHWARQSNPFTLKLGKNVSSTWSPYLSTTSADWSESSILDTTIVAGQGKKNCQPTAGRVEVCSKSYGSTGWLGIASVWASGNHITQGTVKLNDTYFNTTTYNTPAWRNLVMCQEVGHTLGLDHQDEDFGNPNLGTCMDYSNDPSTNQHPNAHDYEQLELIYAHPDSTTTIDTGTGPTGPGGGRPSALDEQGVGENPSDWGKLVRAAKNGKPSVYEKDLGKGKKVFTFVIWADQQHVK